MDKVFYLLFPNHTKKLFHFLESEDKKLVFYSEDDYESRSFCQVMINHTFSLRKSFELKNGRSPEMRLLETKQSFHSGDILVAVLPKCKASRFVIELTGKDIPIEVAIRKVDTFGLKFISFENGNYLIQRIN